jgi:osmoprotectant transport system substrate-binding protein
MHARLITLSGAVAAAALLLSACGSSSTGSGTTGSAGASSPAKIAGTIASKLILGGPAEFQTRPDGTPGLAKNYGVTFQSFKTTDTGGPITVTSLKNGQIDAADLFTTDPAIKANNFVVLTDPKSNFGAQDVLPLISKAKATTGVKTVLNFISSKLTTTDLINLRTQVETDKQDPTAVATKFLQGLGQAPPATLNKGLSITVGSANFPENVVLAEIYAVALKATGATVSTKLNIGSREKYVPGLEDGSINLIPDYSGALLQYFDKTASVTSPSAIYTALQKATPAKLEVLTPSAAQDADAIVVTAATAKKYGLTSIADLAKKS